MSHYTLPPDGPAPAVPASLTLRQQAEARWGAVRQRSPDTFGDMTIRDTHIMLHDLHVHQIELELQNEELRQAKDALDASRARYVDLYDLAPVGYCSVNEAGLIAQANLTLATLLGVARSALVHRPFSSLVIQEDQDSWYRLRKQLLDGGEPQIVELRLRLDTGMVITGTGAGAPSSAQPHVWAQLATTLVQDETGQTLLHIAVSDISARKQADSKLQLAASVFSCAREGIMITDATGLVVDVNDAFTHITGYSRAEAVGQNPRFLSSGRQDSAFYADFWRCLKEQGHWSGEMWNRRKSGEVHAELVNISAVRDTKGTTQQYVALFSGIAAIKEHQG